MTTRSTKHYSADNVAKYFIYLASRPVEGGTEEREGITNLKLQKVLYFAQAYYLAKIGKKLFGDHIEAWSYGPVVPSIYRKYKTYGSNSIIFTQDDSSVPDEVKLILNKIWDIFGGYSASRLVDITHAHTPWKEAHASSSKIISVSALKEYYTPLLNK